jgi:hypothetical protein
MASSSLENAGLTPTERAAADKWTAQHRETCHDATFEVVSAVSGYGYRMKVFCTTCGAREDVTEALAHDPYPHR